MESKGPRSAPKHLGAYELVRIGCLSQATGAATTFGKRSLVFPLRAIRRGIPARWGEPVLSSGQSGSSHGNDKSSASIVGPTSIVSLGRQLRSSASVVDPQIGNLNRRPSNRQPQSSTSDSSTSIARPRSFGVSRGLQSSGSTVVFDRVDLDRPPFKSSALIANLNRRPPKSSTSVPEPKSRSKADDLFVAQRANKPSRCEQRFPASAGRMLGVGQYTAWACCGTLVP